MRGSGSGSGSGDCGDGGGGQLWWCRFWLVVVVAAR